MYKILIITDSTANPRPFPEKEKTHLEETYPYLIKKEFKNSIFYQLTFGNVETEKLLSQAIGYLSHWKPDFIIVQSGLNDCRPEAFSEFQKTILLKFSRFFPLIRRFIHDPKIIKSRQIHRVSQKNFKKTIKRFLSVFIYSKILWLEIVAHSNYEMQRPGITKRMNEYNKILENELKDNLINTKKFIYDVNGFNSDNIHWNRLGHKVVSELILKKIKQNLESKVE